MAKRTLADGCALLRGRDQMLILTHRRPDGDTLGSAAALCRVLRKLGKTAYLHSNEEVTPRLAFITAGLEAPEDFVPAYVIAVDLADESLLPPSAAGFRGVIDLAVDHHPSNRLYAGGTILDASASATGELIFQLMECLGASPDLEIWTALYVAVATDTGCFRFSNTTALAHRMAALAMEAGIDFYALNREFFDRKSQARLKLECYLYSSMQSFEDGAVVGTYLTRQYIREIGASDDDLDNLSTLLIQPDGVECAILLTETAAEDSFKASVRTRKPIDASAVCARFGGGGHARAAGCNLAEPGPRALELLVSSAKEQLYA